jgi:hypothetical protein
MSLVVSLLLFCSKRGGCFCGCCVVGCPNYKRERRCGFNWARTGGISEGKE